MPRDEVLRQVGDVTVWFTIPLPDGRILRAGREFTSGGQRARFDYAIHEAGRPVLVGTSDGGAEVRANPNQVKTLHRTTTIHAPARSYTTTEDPDAHPHPTTSPRRP